MSSRYPWCKLSQTLRLVEPEKSVQRSDWLTSAMFVHSFCFLYVSFVFPSKTTSRPVCNILRDEPEDRRRDRERLVWNVIVSSHYPQYIWLSDPDALTVWSDRSLVSYGATVAVHRKQRHHGWRPQSSGTACQGESGDGNSFFLDSFISQTLFSYYQHRPRHRKLIYTWQA